jgi:predicted nucleic acid-binding protein
VIRPKSPIPDSFPLPKWAELLNATDEKGQVPFPKAGDHFKRIWDYHERHAREARLLPEADARRIRQMFDWPWIRKIDVVPKIAHEATEIMRTHNMRAGDAIHVASAVHRNCDALQRWDKDFTNTDGLIPSEEPSLLTQSDGKGPSLFD